MAQHAMNPRISVLLPVWNAEKTLAACLRSILRQSEPDWECIIVDDGSADDSLEIARQAATQDSRFRVKARIHSGLVATLNSGIDECSSPIIARMDADDWMHRDRLARQANALDDNSEIEAVGCYARTFPRKTMRDGRQRYEKWLGSLTLPEEIWRERFIECPIPHPTLAIRQETLQRLRYRDRGWPEDYDLLLRLLRSGPRVGIVPRRLLGWRDHPDRLSRVDDRYALKQFTACRAWHIHRDFLNEQSDYILWGHGPTGRALRRELVVLGHQARLIVDVHPRRIGNTLDGALVISPDELANHPDHPILVSVSGLKPRNQIRSALDERGLREGIEYVCTA